MPARGLARPEMAEALAWSGGDAADEILNVWKPESDDDQSVNDPSKPQVTVTSQSRFDSIGRFDIHDQVDGRGMSTARCNRRLFPRSLCEFARFASTVEASSPSTQRCHAADCRNFYHFDFL
jgi:hypothetical protein